MSRTPFHNPAPKLMFQAIIRLLATCPGLPIVGLRISRAKTDNSSTNVFSLELTWSCDLKLLDMRETIFSASHESACPTGASASVSTFAAPQLILLLQCKLRSNFHAKTFRNPPREQLDMIRVHRGSLHVPLALPILFSTKCVPKASRRTFRGPCLNYSKGHACVYHPCKICIFSKCCRFGSSNVTGLHGWVLLKNVIQFSEKMPETVASDVNKHNSSLIA